MTIQIRRICSLEELRDLGPRYNSMVLASGDAGFFYQLEWLERVWPYYESRLGAVMSFLVAEEGGHLLGLAPLSFRIKDWIHARQRVVAFIGGTWDELDNWVPTFLFATSAPALQRQIVAAFVESLSSDWDLLELRFVRSTCPSIDVLRSRFPHTRVSAEPLPIPRALLEHGWAPYWASRSKRLTRMLQRGRKRANEDGLPIRSEVTVGIPAERRGDVEAIHIARQKQLRKAGRRRSSPFENGDTRQLFWSLIDWATAGGHLRTHWLRLGTKTAAYVVVLHHAGTAFAYFNAFDPDSDRYHPGGLMLSAMIECEHTAYDTTVIDLMAGANLTKALFATEELPTSRVSVVNPYRLRSRARGTWVRAARDFAAWLKP